MPVRVVILLLLLFNSTTSIAQLNQMEKETAEIKAKGRDSIVAVADSMIRNRFPDLEISPEEFEITAWGNKKEVVVKYRRLIRYVVKDSSFYYDMSVNIGSGKIEPFDGVLYRSNFFIPTDEQQRLIKYLKKLLNLPLQNMDHEVSEDDENYYVSSTSNTAFIHFIVNKKTGRQMEPLRGTYLVAPDRIFPFTKEDDDPLIEIKE